MSKEWYLIGKKKDLKSFVKHIYFRPWFILCFNKERRHYILLLLGLSVRSSTLHSLTQPASQPNHPPHAAQSDIGYDVITSVFQSDRLYYDKVDAHCVIIDLSSSPSLPSQSFSFYATIWTISARTTTEPDPVLLNQDMILKRSSDPSVPSLSKWIEYSPWLAF